MFEKISSRPHAGTPEVCQLVIELAVEIAREGREGRRIGTMAFEPGTRLWKVKPIGAPYKIPLRDL